MMRIAAGTENNVDLENWMPSKINLSVPLMWEILQFNSTTDSQAIRTAGLLDASLTPAIAIPPADTGDRDSSTLEIIVATSPVITINIADGGQEAPTSSYHRKRPGPPSVSSGLGISSGSGDTFNNQKKGHGGMTVFDPTVEQIDSLTFSTTPWLYADPSQLVGIGDISYSQSNELGNAWWEGEDFNNIMFDEP
jgi:hypothetical protein